MDKYNDFGSLSSLQSRESLPEDSPMDAHSTTSLPEAADPASAQRRSPWRSLAAALSFMTLGAGLMLAGSYVTSGRLFPFHDDQSMAAAPIPVNPNPLAAAPKSFIPEVVQRVGPAVVRIDASRTVKTAMPDQIQDPLLRKFLEEHQLMKPFPQNESGVGSGFILKANGQIVTNAHVVDGADTVTVTLKDGRSFKGDVVGADPLTDVAMIKIDAQNLPTVQLANSDQLQPGEWAIAIGNPLGLDNTVTDGIVSATGRSSGQVGAPDQRVDFIQTDAAINPGNSGGPLLNAQGEVIGMNTAIIQDAQGIGFAIPINTVRRIADQLASTGSVTHPFIGVSMVTLTPQLQQEINQDPQRPFSIQRDKGVFIAEVAPQSPAAKAGLKVGDVIEGIENKPITTADQVQERVETSTVGQPLTLEVLRQDKSLTLEVTPSKHPGITQ
jgi:Do/DeqQ family serine protease